MGNLDRREFLGTIAKPAALATVAISNPTLMGKAITKIKTGVGNPKMLLVTSLTGEKYSKATLQIEA